MGVLYRFMGLGKVCINSIMTMKLSSSLSLIKSFLVMSTNILKRQQFIIMKIPMAPPLRLAL